MFTAHNYYINTTVLNHSLGLFFISLRDDQFKQISFYLSSGENLTHTFQRIFRLLQDRNANIITINYLTKNQHIDLSFILVDSFLQYLDFNSISKTFIFIKENKTLLIESSSLNLKIVGFDNERYSKYSKK